MKVPRFKSDCQLLRNLHAFHNDLCSQDLNLFDPGLGSVGLIFDQKLDDSRYDHFTPAKCVTFACTGGDGVHFGFLLIDGRSVIDDFTPIVMMVPASGYFCAILGESLEEFLHLGSIHGYFCLEQFAYSCDSTLEYTGTGRNVLEVEDRDDSDRVLELLRSKFQLRPWTDRGRYAVLQEKYQPLLQEPIEKI